MLAQNKITRVTYEVFAFRPCKLILLIDGRQAEVSDEDYTLEIDPILYCHCDNRKEQPRIKCPLDQDECNCCVYCQDQCDKLKADECEFVKA